VPALSTPRQNLAILVALLASLLFVMSDGAERSGVSRRLESTVMRVSSPAVRLAQAASGGLRHTVTGAGNLLAAHARNAALEVEVQRLRAELVRYREDGPENLRLRRLLGMRETIAPASIAASIVTANQTGKTRIIVVDRGADDGVRIDMPVVAWGGAVGRVIAVDARESKVRLIVDASSGVAGVVQRSRAQGMVLGRPRATLEMLYVPRYSDVMHGDRVVTSGLDGIFPRGYGLGRVSSITQSPDGAQTIRLDPEIDYAALEEVLILLEPNAVEPEPEATAEARP